MEPERKIEKLLRAYAEKRRAKAGDSFKLHPATRRLLQGEVARRKPAADDGETSLSLWELFRTNWAVLAGFALIIFFCASFLMPVLSKAKNKAKSVEAMSDLKQIGVAAQIAAADNHGRLPASLDALTNELGSSLMLTDAVSGQRFIYVAGGEVLDSLQTNTPLAYSPGNKKGHAVLFADGSVRQVRRDEFSALTNRGSSVLTVVAANSSPMPAKAPVNEPATIPATGLPTLAGGRLVKTNEMKSESTISPANSASGSVSPVGGFGSAQRLDGLTAGVGGAGVTQSTFFFKSKLATDSSRFGPTNSQSSGKPAQTATPPVLTSFEVRQSGNNISIVDRDGSIYEGTLQAAAVSEEAQKELGISGNQSSLGQDYSFSVAGTNQTLHQQVVFAGNLATAANVNKNTTFYFEAGKGGGNPLGTTNALPTQDVSNLRISGTITLGSTNHFKIIAVPSAR